MFHSLRGYSDVLPTDAGAMRLYHWLDLLTRDAFARCRFGGAGRDRTADKGFADLCLTTWRPRLWMNPDQK